MAVKRLGKNNMDFIIEGEKITDLITSAKSGEKTATLLSGSREERYSVHSVIVDNFLPLAELHEQARDVWYILSGQGSFILGGKLNDPQSKKPNEWFSESIVDGEVNKVKAGDIIDIPPNVAHQIDARGGRLEMLIVKVRYNI